jgi:lipoate-protein ligase A
VDADLEISVRNGAVNAASLSFGPRGESQASQLDLSNDLGGHKIHEISDWKLPMNKALSKVDSNTKSRLIEWLNKMLPRV